MKIMIITAIMVLVLFFQSNAQRQYQLEYSPGLSKILIQFPRGNNFPFNYQYSQQFRVQKEILKIGFFDLNGGFAFSNFNAELNNSAFLEDGLISMYNQIPDGVVVRNFRYSGYMAGPVIQVNFAAYEKGMFAINPGLGIDGMYVIRETMSNLLYSHMTSYYGSNRLDDKINFVKVIDDLYLGANLRFSFSYSLPKFTVLIAPGIDYQLNNLVKPEYNKHILINYFLSTGIKF